MTDSSLEESFAKVEQIIKERNTTLSSEAKSSDKLSTKQNLHFRPKPLSVARALKEFSERRGKNGKHVMRRLSGKDAAFLAYAARAIRKKQEERLSLSKKKVTHWELKEYFAAFKKAQKKVKPSMGGRQEHTVTDLVKAKERKRAKEALGQELFEERNPVRSPLQTATAWIDLKIKI